MEVWLTADLCACPKCGQPARCWHCERVEDGSVNTYGGLRCDDCGHAEGDLPDQGK